MAAALTATAFGTVVVAGADEGWVASLEARPGDRLQWIGFRVGSVNGLAIGGGLPSDFVLRVAEQQVAQLKTVLRARWLPL